MKKALLASLPMGLIMGFALSVNAQRTCSTMENQARLEQLDPRVATNRARIEAHTAAYAQSNAANHSRIAVTIPVVVHVVYNNATENISDAQIQSQITVLNNDFRRLNADKTNTPAAWSGIAADCEINFCLATVDPNGAATTGITRTSTATTSFTDDDAVKFNSSGGKDAWPATKYLNLWVCDLGTQLLGYAQFPGGPANSDGVVIHYSYFGTTGTATAPYNKGRTATHEVGHWLNLYHIWGDDCGQGDGVCSSGTECSGSDAVTDTPNQCEMTYGTPAVGTVKTDGCTASSPGVMWMNYMDYSDDAAMNMFTSGQKSRMQALFATGGAKVSLLTSTGCGTSNPSYCSSAGSSTADEWIQSVVLGAVINNTSGNNNGYGNYTATTYNVTKGTAYSFTLTPGYTSSAYPEYWKVWIDYNGDKDFLDAGELVYDAGATATTARTGSITIPSTATSGQTRMRVSMKYNAAPTECETFSYGEVEDYTLNIQSSVSCGNPTGLATSSITSSGATLSWTAVSGATSYNIQYKTSAASTWTTTTSTTTSRALTGLSAATTYNWQVQAVCSGGSSSYVAGTNFTTLSATCTDSYEANESLAAAKTISVNTNILAKICTSTDADWFKFTTTSTSPKVKITLTTLPADFDVVLYNASGVQLGSSTNGGTTSESIIYNTATTGATYYVKVFGYNGANSTSSYTLRAGAQAANWARLNGDPDLVPKEELANNDLLQAFPNPAQNVVTINYVTESDEVAKVQIVDLMGQVVRSAPLMLSPGANTLELNVADLSAGIYLVQAETSRGLKTVRLMVSH